MIPTDDEIAAVVECFRGGWLTQGPRVRELETVLGDLFGCHVRAVGTPTAALQLALRVLDVGSGDDVLVSPAVATSARVIVASSGATPVVGTLEGISSRTAAVVVDRHRGSDLVELRRACDAHGVRIIEEVTGLLDGRPAEVGGDLAYLSLAAPLGVGSGGAVLTASEALADRVASLRSHAMTSGTWERHHGREETYDVVDLGYNHRFDEPRAVLALRRMAVLGARVQTR
ncbi:DegT/DnrJ/EryC1/StrS family aminotransferase [Actinomycetospora sp. CA-084318]|uniref:DegT/DnrJ/EryC1/StrS family aminotransferase n=1 Tax=Actinomycetospora sp. CA-084318 TaxID=3239892 RepID=UPI003D96225F